MLDAIPTRPHADAALALSIVVPWTGGCTHRERAWEHVRALYADAFPEVEIVEGEAPAGPYNRSAAIIDGARRSSGDVLVVADADVWCEPAALTKAVAAAVAVGWAVPHMLLHRLSEDSTARVYAGADWRGLPLSRDNAQDRRPYRGNETGTLLAITRDAIEDVPPDRRFVGWGQEDQAWAIALRGLIGPPWRGTADLVHLWHPAQPRRDRVIGNAGNRALLRRYQQHRQDPAALRALVDESKAAA